jgi:hypothetical protein
MKSLLHYSLQIAIVLLLLSGCGGGSSSGTTTQAKNPLPSDTNITVVISGKLQYERVAVNSNGIGLDYTNISSYPIRLVTVEAIDRQNSVLSYTTSDNAGKYTLDVPANTEVKIRISAQIQREGTPGWNVKVVDNTDQNTLYILEGSYIQTGTINSKRDLTAMSGWDSEGNDVAQRTAAPFAILDSIYTAMEKILSIDANTFFPPLTVHWSVKNVPSNSFDAASGQIVTSLYSESNLYILGAKDLDTDEYDDHIIAHEWGHYYEDKFSRSDSLGGAHGDGDYLDIRVAFSEGFGNAFSAIALDEPRYFDTMGSKQSYGFHFNMENQTQINPGWYSESSIQRILYDLYDENNDGADELTMGFAPLHNIFTKSQKQTKAFTSLFSFITNLKNQKPADSSLIDMITTNESIAPITDIYGSGRTNLHSEAPYITLTDLSGSACTSSIYGSNHNNLSNHRYVRFTIDSNGKYKITIKDKNSNNTSDPDFEIYRSTPSFEHIGGEFDEEKGIEEGTYTLNTGEYLLDISDWQMTSNACFEISITK